jgi:hypothetical protein
VIASQGRLTRNSLKWRKLREGERSALSTPAGAQENL